MPQSPNIISTWSDTGAVHIYDAEVQLKSLDGPALPGSKQASECLFIHFLDMVKKDMQWIGQKHTQGV